MGCIYMWTNNVNGKKYVGKCHGDIDKRRKAHLSSNSKCPAIKRAIAKYGADNFIFEILIDGVFDELLDDYEIYYIKHFKSRVPNGYNLTDGGGGIKGCKFSPEARKKMSENRKGKNNPHYGKKHSAETRRKMSETRKGRIPHNLGKKHSAETRRKISKAIKGNTYCKGRKVSAETREKMAKVQRHPSYVSAQKLFVALPVNMPLKEKRKRLIEAFPEVPPRTIRKWVQKDWT